MPGRFAPDRRTVCGWLRAAALAGLAWLAGCAAPGAPGGGAPALLPAPAYAAPTDGVRATLLVRVQHGGGRYAVANFQQPVSCSGRRDILSGAAKEPERASTQITAGRLQTLSFVYLRADQRVCEVALSFVPQRGRTYLMRNIAEGEGCRVELLDTSAAETLPVALLRRERIGYGLHENACKPLTSTVLPATRAPAGGSLDDFRQLLPRR